MPEAPNTDISTALFQAVSRRRTQQFLKLLAPGVDVDSPRNGEGRTLLREAMDVRADDIAFALLDRGAAIDVADANLVWAALVRRPDVVRKFIELGADVNINTALGTPLSVAAGPPASMRPGSEEDLLEIIRLLIDAGADLNAGNTLGSPLEKAVARNATQAALLLIEAGASLERTKHQAGQSLPELAAQNGNAELAKALTEATNRPRAPRQSRAKKPAAADPVVAALQELCGSKAQRLDGVAGAWSAHVDSSRKLDLPRAQTQFLTHGHFLFAADTDATRLVIIPGTDKYQALRTMGTNGANYDLSTDDIIAWLKNLEGEEPFTLTGVGFDFISGHFDRDISDPAALARRMYEFCPDIVDQGMETVEALEEGLRTTNELYFWWD